MARSYYEVLGVERNASDEALKKAFRKQAMANHPDRNPDDAKAEARFKAVNEAYEVLKDSEKRAAYDAMGHEAYTRNGGQRAGPRGGFQGGFEGFGDIFEEMFGSAFGGGAARSRRSAARGSDVRLDYAIHLEDAHEGKTVELRVPGSQTCETCNGSGAAPGTQPVTCSTCGGRGKIRSQQGFFSIERSCPTCGGRGEIIETPCATCKGSGRVTKERTLSVHIPAGVEDGMRIRLSGEGEAGPGGAPAGDLYIFLGIKPHDLFEREGPNLQLNATVPMTLAALGGSIEVPSVDGNRHRIRLPAGTQSGQTFRLRGQGMAVYKASQRGDLFVEVSVETPRNLNEAQKELLEQFAGSYDAEGASKAGKFMNRVKDFFRQAGK